MSKFCPNCGEELIDNARFCKNCGANLENISNPNTANTNFQVPVVEKDHKAAIIIGYILAILIPLFGLIVSIYLITRDSPKAKKHGKYILALTLVIWFLSILSTIFY